MNYKLLKDAYYGTGGFASGSYLQKHKRETDENYRIRCRIAYYLNYFAPIVNALVNPIFRKETFRDWSGKEEVELFLNDIDCAGSDIQAFM